MADWNPNKDKGRIDWMPRLKVWRAIIYRAFSDVKIGDYQTREEAVNALQDVINRRK